MKKIKYFEGFDYKNLDYRSFIDTKETLTMNDTTGFYSEWNKDIEEMNKILNEAFEELAKNKEKEKK